MSEVASESDWSLAQTAVDLITERGFARDRDIPAALDELRRCGAY